MARAGRAMLAGAAAPRPGASMSSYLDALGGQTAGTRWLALERAGLDPSGPLPPAGSTDYRRYRSARRTIERWRKYEAGGGGEARRPSASWLAEQRGAVRAESTRRRVDKMRRRGVRARIGAVVRISADERARVIPDGPPGPGLYMGPREVADALDALAAGRSAEAESLFIARFLARYMGGAGAADLEEGELEEAGGGMEISEVRWIRVWPDGEAEPA